MANPKPTNSFKKGKDPRRNLKGAPKKEWTWSGLLKKCADEAIKGKTKKEWIAESLFKEAMKGNIQAIKEFGDRVEGKPVVMEPPSENENELNQHFSEIANELKKIRKNSK